ncbi:MAG: flagellar export chaperone FliS [Rhodospirillales bacterium]
MSTPYGNVNKYLTQQVVTASPAKLVYMLYDKAIASLREAIAAVENGDVQARWRGNNRAVEIISHMWSTLDLDRGGDIAGNLNRLFPFMISQLTDVDLHNDATPAREVIKLLEPLRDAWREIALGTTVGDAAAAPETMRARVSA